MIPTFFEAAVQSSAACYRAGMSANMDFVILVQDYAGQLISIGNENDELSRTERERMLNELYERSTALIKAAKGGA